MTRDHTIIDIPGVMMRIAEVADLVMTIDIPPETMIEDIEISIAGTRTTIGDPTMKDRDSMIELLDTKRTCVYSKVGSALKYIYKDSSLVICTWLNSKSSHWSILVLTKTRSRQVLQICNVSLNNDHQD
jgi:hypothetical protein